MISIAKPSSAVARRAVAKRTESANCQERFLALLPAIRRHAQVCLRHLDSASREEATAGVVAHAWDFFVRLVASGREELAFASPLARYGVARILDGRQVGNQLNVHDVTSTWCQCRKGVRLEPLDQRDPANGEWQQILLEDRTASPADIAAMRIDFRAWLLTLSRQQRRVAQCLARDERTRVVAHMCRLSPGRVSQMRGELKCAWRRFQGEWDREATPV